MLLTPTTMEKPTVCTALGLARKRRASGRKLNHPDAKALIAVDGRKKTAVLAGTSATCCDDDARTPMNALREKDWVKCPKALLDAYSVLRPQFRVRFQRTP
jgi:hypothetical protein